MAGDEAGDFHDIVDLRDGRVAVVVGDAPGYGPAAAAIAEELRGEIRRGFRLTDDVVAVLADLDSRLARRSDELIATAACAVVDPVSQTVRIVNAGHLPLVVTNGSHVDLVDSPADPPLGIIGDRVESMLPLERDTSLFLYTDGLIERRGVPIDRAISRLLAVTAGIGGASAWASEFARRATEEFGQPTDDATVLSVRLDTHRAPAVPRPPVDDDRDKVTLRLYVDPRDLRSRDLLAVAREFARRSESALDVAVDVVDVTSASSETEDAGVLAAPTVVRVEPAPAVRVIGWFQSPAELARALQLPVPKE